MDWGQEALLIEGTANPLKSPTLHFQFLQCLSLQYSTRLLSTPLGFSCTKFRPISGFSLIPFPFPGQLFFLFILRWTFIVSPCAIFQPLTFPGHRAHLSCRESPLLYPSVHQLEQTCLHTVLVSQTVLPRLLFSHHHHDRSPVLGLNLQSEDVPMTQTCCSEMEPRLGSLGERCFLKGTCFTVSGYNMNWALGIELDRTPAHPFGSLELP